MIGFSTESKIVSEAGYGIHKSEFLLRHGDFKIITSGLDDAQRYRKAYVCEDDAVWTEINGPEDVTEEVYVKGVPVLVTVKLFRTEFWSTDDSRSRYTYSNY